MNEWLKQWGATTKQSHEGHDLAGMMSDDDMAKLESSSGPGFDRRWLDMMIKHGAGAIRPRAIITT